MQYAALLRGINVGGNNKVPMAELRRVLEAAGFREVRTYIASGNVLFSPPSPDAADEQKLSLLQEQFEEIMNREFGISTRVLIVAEDRFRHIRQALPDGWTNDKAQKSDVLFLFPEEDDPATLDQLAPKPDIDRALYVPGAILWNVSRTDQTRSVLLSVLGTRLYKAMTIRNVNTVRKLADMLDERI